MKKLETIASLHGTLAAKWRKNVGQSNNSGRRSPWVVSFGTDSLADGLSSAICPFCHQAPM